MATATSRRLLPAVALVALLTLAGCGGAARQGAKSASRHASALHLAATRRRAGRLEDRQAAIPNS